MAKKSFAEKFGEWWYNQLFYTGEAAMVQAEGQRAAGEAIHTFLKDNMVDLTSEEQKLIAELILVDSSVVTGVAIKAFTEQFGSDFSKGYKSVEWDNLSEDEKDAIRETSNEKEFKETPVSSENIITDVSKAEIESQMGSAFGVDDTIQEAATSEEELLKQTGPTGGLEGTQLAAYLTGVTGKTIEFDEETKQLRYVLDDNGEIELSPRMTPTNAYQATTGSQTPVDWLQNPDGSAVLDTLTGQPIPLAFSVGDDLFADGGGIDSFIKDFIKPKATTAMVRELENWLIDLGLASEDDFADDGLWSDTLEKGLKGLMEFANQNYSHVQPGTDYYNSFLERVPDNFQWTGESDMERVGWALIGQAALDVQERWPGRQKGLREAELSRIKSASPMPGFNEMRLQIKYWIEGEGGDASEESIDKYVKQWIADQEGFYDDTVSLYDANELNNQFRYFIKSTGQYIDSKWGQSLMGDIAPGTEVGDSWNDQSVIVDREDKSDITPETGRWTVQGSIVDEYAPTRNAEEQRERQRQLYYAAAGKLG